MMIIENRMRVVDKPQVAYHSLYDLKKFIEEKVVHPYTFNLKINNHWLDFILPMHTLTESEWETVNLMFSVFIINNGRTSGYLMVENFLEDKFSIDVSLLKVDDSLISKIHSEDATHLCHSFINVSHFSNAIETIMSASYKALYQAKYNNGFVHGLVN